MEALLMYSLLTLREKLFVGNSGSQQHWREEVEEHVAYVSLSCTSNKHGSRPGMPLVENFAQRCHQIGLRVALFICLVEIHCIGVLAAQHLAARRDRRI